MILEKHPSLHDMIEPVVTDLGFELVRVAVMGAQKAVLQIMVEGPDGNISIDDCAKVSREVSALLDVEDPIKSDFVLEVSSPGLDRPLTRVKDFERFAGFEIKLETTEAINGQRRFKGPLTKVTEAVISITTQEGDFDIEFSNIQKAKLVITDDLIKASQKDQLLS